MSDWLLDDRVRAGPPAPEWSPPRHFTDRYGYIRQLNETLPASERIHVRSVDVNEDDYGGASEFALLLRWLVGALGGDEDVLTRLGSGYGTASPAEQTALLDALRDALASDRARLTGRWGTWGFGQVEEMLEIERESITVRAEDGDDASRSRESVIKRLVDQRLTESDGPTVIDIGGQFDAVLQYPTASRLPER